MDFMEINDFYSLKDFIRDQEDMIHTAWKEKFMSITQVIKGFVNENMLNNHLSLVNVN